MPTTTVASCICTLTLSLAVLAGTAAAQSSGVVRISAAQYKAAPLLALDSIASWCRDPEAPGCDVRRFSHAQLLPDGGIVASDARPPVKRFDKAGRYLHDVTRLGSGPGELRNVIAMRYAGGDSVWLYANFEMRLVQSALSGTGGTSETVMPPLTVHDMGFLGTQPVAWSMGRVKKAGNRATGALYSMPRDTTKRRALFTFELPSLHEEGSGEFIRMPPPLSPMTQFATGASGNAAYADGRRYEISVVPPNAARWQLVADVSPRRVTRAERDSVIAVVKDRAKRLQRDPMLKNAMTAAEEGLRNLPAFHGALTSLALLRDGTLLVRTMPAANVRRVRWDAYTTRGALIGQLELLLQENILDGDQSQLLIGRIDDAGVPSVTLYRLRAPKPNEIR